MNIKIKFNKIEIYFSLLILYYFLMSLTNLTRLSSNINLIRPVLLFLLLVNVLFIIEHIKYVINVNLFVILLFAGIGFATVYGIISNGISFRSATDVLKPLVFLFIYTIFSKIDLPDQKLLNRVSRKLFLITVVFGFLTMVFYLMTIGRTGVVLPFGLPLSVALYNVNIFGMLLLILATFLSGNRASFISAAIVTFFLLILRNKKYFIYTLVLISLLFLIYRKPIINSGFYKRNIEYTFTQGWNALKNKDFIKLDQVSSGRISEIVTIFSDYKGVNYFLGKGIGYEYQAKRIINNNFDLVLIDKEKGNSHFSPLALYLSYGIFFAGMFYILIFYYLKVGFDHMKENFFVFIGFYIILFTSIESLFSFQIFNNPFLPIACGWIERYKRNLLNQQ